MSTSHDDMKFREAAAAGVDSAAQTGVAGWKVLIVDDEEDVHATLRFALRDVLVEGRPLQLIDAYSAREAKDVVAANQDLALILLDVVMESDHAGLDFVRDVRREVADRSLQIVLITGQPGYAPQSSVVGDYEVDGYRLKSELGADSLLLTVHLAIRTHRLLQEQASLQRELRQKVSELGNALQALRESENKLLRAQSVAHVGSFTYDVAVDRVELSAEACRIYGVAEGTVASYWQYLAWVYPDDRAALIEEWRSALSAGHPFAHEHRILSGNAVRHVRLHAEVVCGADGRPLRGVGTTQDITDRKQAEEVLRRSNAELEQFTYAISHDLRQPLRMISSYLQLLAMSMGSGFDPEQKEYFRFAIDGAKRLDQMLVALLEYSRLDRPREPARTIDTRAIVNEALAFLQPEVKEAMARVDIDGIWPRLNVRADELLRLAQNLIANAIKFRVPGKAPEVRVCSRVSGGEWRLSVTDNGIGMDPAQAGRLFQVFQRLQSRTAYEGSGVGLALCRKIAERHGGRIGVESAGEGRGCEFWVALPLIGEGEE